MSTFGRPEHGIVLCPLSVEGRAAVLVVNGTGRETIALADPVILGLRDYTCGPTAHKRETQADG